MAATSVYVAVSGQIALQRRLETIANNIANMSTSGFRADEVKFDTVLSNTGTETVAFPSGGKDYISRKAGPISHTGNSLDVAVRGAGWFAFAANGKTVYTRDGRFHINDLGDLKTVNNYNVLDPGGAPITIDPAAGPVTIGEDGAISQGKSQIGALGVFLIPETAKLTHHDNSGVISDKPAVPAEDMTVNGVRQGYLESSNVNPIVEMTKLIEVSRAFDNAVAATQSGDTTTDDMIKTLGPTS